MSCIGHLQHCLTWSGHLQRFSMLSSRGEESRITRCGFVANLKAHVVGALTRVRIVGVEVSIGKHILEVGWRVDCLTA